jgi:hypothetical protein
MRVQVSWKAGLAFALTTTLALSGCLTGTETEDDNATNTFVQITAMTSEAATSTGTQAGIDLNSDVCVTATGSTVCQAMNDNGVVTMVAQRKDQSQLGSSVNDIQFSRYRVTYVRSDGRNVPGVDVPYPFDGVSSFRLPIAGGEITRNFMVVRPQAKLESPLVQLRRGTSDPTTNRNPAQVLSTLAEIDFYGTDISGREIKVTGYLNITFADF